MGLTPGTPARQPKPDGLSARDRNFHRGLAAAQAFPAREGHLDVSQRHVEDLDTEPVRLGQWISNIRRRWDHLTSDRRQALQDLGLRRPAIDLTDGATEK
ncbi:helicase associated domain-containing protein [Streptomyces sp. NPDC005146]